MIERTLDWIDEVNGMFRIQPSRVLDIGSRDYNGNPRNSFSDSEYVGIDIRKGRNVDKVISAYEIGSCFEENHFDAVLCLHLLEHIAMPWKVLDGVGYVLATGGHFYVAMPTLGYPKHNYPKDYWRITEEAMREVIMQGYNILSLEHAKSKFSKHPIINCLGTKI